MTHHSPSDHHTGQTADETNERPPGAAEGIAEGVADGYAVGAGVASEPTWLTRRSGRRKRLRAIPPTTRLLELTPAPSALSPDAPKTWLLTGWEQRREQYLQRLGEWAALQMKRLDLSTRDLEALAARTGEAASNQTFHRLARQRERERNPAVARERISFSLVLWLMTLSGQSFADLGEFLRTGDARELEPGVDARADTLRAAYRALSPERARSLEAFAQFLYQQDAAERTLTITPVFASGAGDATDAADATGADDATRAAQLASADAEVLHVEAHLRDAADRLRAREAAQPDAQPGVQPADDTQPDDDTHKRRRRQSR